MQLTVILAVFIALLLEDCWINYPGLADVEFLQVMQGGSVPVLTVGVLVLTWAMYRFWNQRVLRLLEAGASIQQNNLQLPQRLDMISRTMNILVYVLLLTVGGWSRQIYIGWELQRFVLLDEIALLLPFILLLIANWHASYPINRFIREYIVMGQITMGLAARPVWNITQFILFQLRHGVLIILMPLLLMLGLKDIIFKLVMLGWSDAGGILSPAVDAAAQGMILLGTAIIFLFAPLIIRTVWMTRPLPEGPLRQRLEAFCRRLQMGFRAILLWDTYGSVANAAVMGLVSRVRYFLISDNIVENMSDEQIEAIFGHEAGHIKHHHIFFLVLFIMGSGLLILFGVELIGRLLLRTGIEFQVSVVNITMLTIIAVAIVAAWLLLFGLVSRLFERQSDVYAARVVGSQMEGTRLNEHGAFVMGRALQRVAQLNGIAVEAPSFRHSSIQSRMELLRYLSQNENALKRFDNRLRWTKLIIVTGFIVGSVGWAILMWFDQGIQT